LPLVAAGEITTADANLYHHHLVNIILAKMGIVHYETGGNFALPDRLTAVLMSLMVNL
jgi:hypothetical protein